MALTTCSLCYLFACSVCSLPVQGVISEGINSYSPVLSNANANINATHSVRFQRRIPNDVAVYMITFLVLGFASNFFWQVIYWKFRWLLARRKFFAVLKFYQRVPGLRAKANLEIEKRNLESINYLKFQPRPLLNSQTLSFRCQNQSVHLNIFTGNITDDNNKSLAIFRSVRGGFVSIQLISVFFADFSSNPEIFANSVPAYIERIEDSIPTLYLEPQRCWPRGHADTLLWLNNAYKFLVTHHFQNDTANLIFSAVLLNYKASAGTVGDYDPETAHSFVLKNDGDKKFLYVELPEGAECCLYPKLLELRTHLHPSLRIGTVPPLHLPRRGLFATRQRHTSSCMDYLDMDLDQQKILENIRTARALLSQNLHFQNLSKLQWHSEGAQVKRSWLGTLATYCYLLLVVAFAFVVVNLNWNERRGLPERFFDGFTVLSIGLVLVFGLLKLKSEDPNYMRNQLIGVKVFKSIRTVCSYLDITEAMLKCLLEAKGDVCRWVSDKNTGAMDIPCTGELRFERGCSTTEVMAMGKLLLYNIQDGNLRLYDSVKDRYCTAKWEGVDRAIVESREFTSGGEPGPHDVVVRGPVIIE